jgi:hypothetical protein
VGIFHAHNAVPDERGVAVHAETGEEAAGEAVGWPQFGMTLSATWIRRGWNGGINYTRLKPEENPGRQGLK